MKVTKSCLMLNQKWIWVAVTLFNTMKNCHGFSVPPTLPTTAHLYEYSRGIVKSNLHSRRKDMSLQNSYNGNRGTDESRRKGENSLDMLREKATNLALIEFLLCGQTSNGSNEEGPSLVQVDFVGTGMIGDEMTQYSSECLFLALRGSGKEEETNENTSPSLKYTTYDQSLPVPLSDSSSKGVTKLLSFAYKGQPISKSLCLTLNPLLINRDGGLYDNLPWESWTIDPLQRNRDAANNPIDKKYHLGKRDAYNRFMGKDWYGRSLSIGNLAARAKYLLENEDMNENVKNNDTEEQNDEISDNTVEKFDASASFSLAQRVLELEVKEARMAVAEVEEQLAITKAEFGSYDLDALTDEELIDNFDALQSSEKSLQEAKDSLSEREEALETLMSRHMRQSDIIAPEAEDSFLGKLLSAIVDMQETQAPYRGAIGYKPVIDDRNEMFQKSVLPYSSPFEIMNEIIEEQLNAEVIGAIIEDTSLFSGSTVFGGGIVLKRRGKTKTVSIEGEEMEFEDDDDDYGNIGIKKGEVMIVECDCDEAIGMALTCGLSITIDKSEWEKSKISLSSTFSDPLIEEANPNSMDVLPKLETAIETIVIADQGDGVQSQNTKIQKPRGDLVSFFGPSDDRKPVFNTDIPVKSLAEFDTMTDEGKAQLLLSLESFKGELPRPRILRDAKNSAKQDSMNLSPIDEMLLPLIDESVRRQILMRSAENNGDFEALSELERAKSRRQRAKEKYDEAKDEGKDELAAMWKKEADFYGSLRADVTQDEGSYSSFLDRDEWYERTRQKLAEKNKKRFGSLLDGLE